MMLLRDLLTGLLVDLILPEGKPIRQRIPDVWVADDIPDDVLRQMVHAEMTAAFDRHDGIEPEVN